jgi:hypothetical protein
MISLKSAIATIHRDPLWWRKVLIGGALWLTMIGYPIVEGFQLESIENSEKGYPAPLPRWDMLSTKMVLGIFATVIDFFFFIFPLIIIGLLLLCSALAVSLAGTSNVRPLGLIVIGLTIACVATTWMSSASPIAKRLYVIEGQLEQALSTQVLRAAWRQPARSLYLRARLQSLPLLLIALALLAAAWISAALSGWLALFLVWLALSTLFYVRLIVIQLYTSAGKEIERLNFEAWQQRAGL